MRNSSYCLVADLINPQFASDVGQHVKSDILLGCPRRHLK